MVRVEAANVTRHCHQPRLFLGIYQSFSIREVVCHWDFNKHVLAGLKCLNRLHGMYWGWGCQYHPFDTFMGYSLLQIQAPMGYVTGLSQQTSLCCYTSHQLSDFYILNVGESIQMFIAKSAFTCHAQFHQLTASGQYRRMGLSTSSFCCSFSVMAI